MWQRRLHAHRRKRAGVRPKRARVCWCVCARESRCVPRRPESEREREKERAGVVGTVGKFSCRTDYVARSLSAPVALNSGILLPLPTFDLSVVFYITFALWGLFLFLSLHLHNLPLSGERDKGFKKSGGKGKKTEINHPSCCCLRDFFFLNHLT